MGDYKLVPVGRPQIREVFLRNGFTIAPDRDDLEDRVYEAAFELLELAKPAVQGEPVGWQFYQHGEWWNGDHRIKDHRKNTEEAGFRVRDVYAGPQPAEQQPVRLPQRAKPQKDDSASIHGFCDGWNNCLDEVARLNGDRMANPEPDVAGLLEALEEARRELNSCQSVIHYAGGFDPAYVTGAQAALVKIDAALAAHRKQEPSHDNQ